MFTIGSYCSDVDYIDTWKAMENLVKLGLVKSIGVSNFNSEQIDRLLQVAEIKPVTNQVTVIAPFLLQMAFEMKNKRTVPGGVLARIESEKVNTVQQRTRHHCYRISSVGQGKFRIETSALHL